MTVNYMRVNQYLAHATGISRREADKWVDKGLVEINDEIAEMGQQVLESDKVRIYKNDKWQLVQNAHGQGKNSGTMLFYKPIFAVTTRKDPQKRKTIYDFLPKRYHSYKPAGRLDYMSEGLLVLSTDGNLIQELTHPSFRSQKQYFVGLKEPLPRESIKMAMDGFELEGYELNSVKITLLSPKQLADYGYLKPEQKLIWYCFELSEGRNNQIRKMCQLWGQEVKRLIRVSQGEYKVTPDLYKNKYISQ